MSSHFFVMHPSIILFLVYILSVLEFTANLYCICISVAICGIIEQMQISCKFWDTQYVQITAAI